MFNRCWLFFAGAGWADGNGCADARSGCRANMADAGRVSCRAARLPGWFAYEQASSHRRVKVSTPSRDSGAFLPMRHRWLLTLAFPTVLSGPSSPTGAFHTVFDYSVDRLELDGKVWSG